MSVRQVAWESVTQSAVSEQQAFTLSRNPKAFCKHRTQLWKLPALFARVRAAPPHAALKMNPTSPNVVGDPVYWSVN